MTDYRELDPFEWLQVTITAEGAHRQGFLSTWHKRDGVWWGRVHWVKGDGQNTAGWFAEGEIVEGWVSGPE